MKHHAHSTLSRERKLQVKFTAFRGNNVFCDIIVEAMLSCFIRLVNSYVLSGSNLSLLHFASETFKMCPSWARLEDESCYFT